MKKICFLNILKISLLFLIVFFFLANSTNVQTYFNPNIGYGYSGYSGYSYPGSLYSGYPGYGYPGSSYSGYGNPYSYQQIGYPFGYLAGLFPWPTNPPGVNHPLGALLNWPWNQAFDVIIPPYNSYRPPSELSFVGLPDYGFYGGYFGAPFGGFYGSGFGNPLPDPRFPGSGLVIPPPVIWITPTEGYSPFTGARVMATPAAT